MTPRGDFGPMMPGLDFMQKLIQSAGAAMPGLGAWMTPTLDPEELDKRIADLRTVQFWLEQNARLISTTIQTLEVQRMTLASLKNLNLSVAELGEAFALKEAGTPSHAEAKAAQAAQQGSPRASARGRRTAHEPRGSAGGAPAAGLIDPVQWWTTLTQQFAEIAARAVRDSAAAADALAVTPGPAAGDAPKAAGPSAPARRSAAAPPPASVAHKQGRPQRRSARGAKPSR